MDQDFVRMLDPNVHFVGAKDPFASPCHTGSSVLSALNRSACALGYVNANVKILIEVKSKMKNQT